MIQFYCNFPGCCEILPERGYCSKHINFKKKPFENASRPNAKLYHSEAWKKLRIQWLEEHPFCCMCGTRQNLQVHHKKPPRGNERLFFDWNNLATICADCHRFITAQEIRERNSQN